ncbi:retron system putative HNH endonuclease [Janthinobacterium agaricidamnosum]|nr:retron system putative HNH endonuclease [Janthinobacterium agaricidamnosum]
MRRIDKGKECIELTHWKRKNPNGRYIQIDDPTRRAIRQSLLDEQHGLCAFCCQQLPSIDECHNEHLQAQATHNTKTLDHDNLVASCNTKKQCGDAHGSQSLPLTPLMHECETELHFKLSGRVEGSTDRAKEAIRVLNLGDSEDKNKALISRRKQLCDALMWNHYGNNFENLQPEDDEVIELLINEISQPENGYLEPFSPVLVSMLRKQLRT